MIEKDKQIRRIRRKKTRKIMNQIKLYEWGLSNKRQQKTCTVQLYNQTLCRNKDKNHDSIKISYFVRAIILFETIIPNQV